jgi:nucleoside-diphosphate-sugar epimerase
VSPAPAGKKGPALVIGGAGFIGSNLCGRLLNDGAAVRVLDNLSRPGVGAPGHEGFYDFTAEHVCGTSKKTLASPPDAWAGRTAVEWVDRLAKGQRFDPSAEQLVQVATVLHSICERGRAVR